MDDGNQGGEILIDKTVIWKTIAACGALEIDEHTGATVTVQYCTIVSNDAWGLEIPYHEGHVVENPNHYFHSNICWNNKNSLLVDHSII